MEENEIIIDRNDNEWEIASESSIVYNLKSISKLAKEKLDHILPVIKKMILGSTFIFNWKIINSIQFIIEVHILLILSSITAMAVNKELTSDKVNIIKFLHKFLLLNTITLPIWLATYYLIIIPSNKVHDALFNMSSFILDKETLSNETVSYKLKKDFSIQITQKPKQFYKTNNNHKETLENLYNYVILSESLVNYAVNICLFFEDKINSYEKLLDKEDSMILNQFLYHNQREIERSIVHFINKYIIPTVISFGSYMFYSKSTPPVYVSIAMFCTLVIIWIIIIKKEKELVRNMDNYIDNCNNDLIRKGKFIFRLHSLLSVFSLTHKGCRSDKKEIKEFIIRICSYKSNMI